MTRLVLVLTLTLATPSVAQTDPDALDRKVAERIDAAKAVTGVPDPRDRCRPKPGSDEIVVCVDRGEDQQINRETIDSGTLEGRRALDGNIPSAPFVGTIKCKRGADGVCRGNFGGAPPPVYYVDVSKLPEAPPGSDADQIAKDEAAVP